MKAVVVGSGGWGTALALVLCDNGHDVTLWSHNPEKAAQMTVTRENPLLKGVHLPESMKITGDLSCLEGADLVVTASPSFAVRETGRKIAPYLRPDSIVYQYSDDNFTPSDVDWIILKLLYDPSIQCGMNYDSCRTIIEALYY